MIIFLFIWLIIYFIKLKSSKLSKMLHSDYPFECGVSSNSSSRKSFSLPFFFISIIFLMFDLEIIILFPMIFYVFNFLTMIMFWLTMLLLLFSLFMEWIYGSLNWV
uniref:NADH-ubiquinone oxidoreductase chain 3 n=1 Tax=Liposcelis sculptilimacula TaxID=1899352 RepID=A0A191ZS75_9NEOP|nr:NADH dehydrogenase subunit 3 [Liposcelis keleri]ANJ70942.1 NADH dehydrogenase subunit 3 [Liposcelis sculptilimacula]